MIEAILRKDPYFTYSAKLIHTPFPDTCEEDQDGDTLSQAATAYEDWHERCFDEVTMTVICPDDDLPRVNWQYRQVNRIDAGTQPARMERKAGRQLSLLEDG